MVLGGVVLRSIAPSRKPIDANSVDSRSDDRTPFVNLQPKILG